MQDKKQKIYIAIDLKSFYASVECKERGLDPLTTNLVVADSSRTEKTVCLAVSPSLKQYGISGRARLFEVIQKVTAVNDKRKRLAFKQEFYGSSYNDIELKKNKNLKLDYIVATPRMSYYIKYSTDIYKIYLKYFAPEDIYVYSIDEVFCDITDYLMMYNMSAKELVTIVIKDVYNTTGITATAGIGTNLYLAKVAMDIVAKHVKSDKNGVRIACLNEMLYKKLLWNHSPITDFWRIGQGYSKKLEKYRIFTMGDIARTSIENEELLYNLFGVNAELLIDHSWGWEPVTIKDIKNYKPRTNSISSGQVLHCPYDYKKTKLIVKEMTELLTLELVEKNLVTSQMVLTIGYDSENLTNSEIKRLYNSEITIDRYGRNIPKHAHGTVNLDHKTSSSKQIIKAVMNLYEKIMNDKLLVRRINITANNVENISEIQVNNKKINYEQIDLFSNYEEIDKKMIQEKKKEKEERELQKAMINIKKKFGKNSILKGMNFEDGGTTIERNSQIGGHKS